MLNIVKASAGSGKTFLLAKTYIRLLLASDDRYAYRHILAVTFTNKATDEMKSRIIKELDVLARNPAKSGYYKEFSAEFGSAAELKSKAENLLFDILHDYGSFSVSTIDKFFQSALKSFAREIGQFSSYQIELDKDSLIKESVARMLDDLTVKDTAMLDWLRESVINKIMDGGKESLDNDLFNTCRTLKSDMYREVIEKNGVDEEKFFSRENISGLSKACRRYRKGFEGKVKDAAEKIISVFQEAGVSPEETSHGFAAGLYKYIEDAGAALNDYPGARLMQFSLDSGKWFPKKNAKKYLPLLEGVLNEPFRHFTELFGREYEAYRTCGLIAGGLNYMGLASEFNAEFNALMREKNVLDIDDSNTLLRRIIDGSDAPFVYEKLGVRYDHFLLDEFQDTSSIQWENFRPLLKESEAGGNENLIVGDIKQSIYRWRGSDWNLLGSQVKLDFPQADDSVSLRSNWRSSPDIVGFNNGFFGYAAAALDGMLGNSSGENFVSRIYADVSQEPMAKGDASLDFVFCPENEENAEILKAIRSFSPGGPSDYGKTAVVVRRKEIGSAVASYLIDNGIPVISDDSLKVRSSKIVRQLVSLLHYTADSSDKINAYLAEELDITVPESYLSLPDLAESYLRELKKGNPGVFENETLFIQSFMDCLQEWTSVNGNSLPEFLEYWEENKDGLSISSPKDPGAVRIITVHKAKGLEYPYVIFPYVEDVVLDTDESRWCHPDAEGTPLEEFGEGVYYVKLSAKKTSGTLFAGDYEENRRLMYVDALNLMYVAMTRACRGLYVIGNNKSRAGRKNMREVLYSYLDSRRTDFKAETVKDEKGETEREHFSQGAVASDSCPSGGGPLIEEWESSYPSFPLNAADDGPDGGTRERGRLRTGGSGADFFSGELSPRLKGIVLHDILSSVKTPSDLGPAIDSKLRCGDIPESMAEEYRSLLSARIAYGAGLGWFPDDPSLVSNEQSLIDTDGEVYRPDRVVRTGEGLMVIDYKFGEEKPIYIKQIGKYASLLKAMGHGDVKACLWYVYENKIVYLP